MDLETDYLIIGAGAAGLAFADELLDRSDARMLIVDRRHAPGGHWNDSYGFVKLHQPSVFYGVGSRALGDKVIDTEGPNAGFLSLASGAQVTGYFHAVMYERLLASGRVTYLPMHEVTETGAVHNLLTGECFTPRVQRRIVDAGYLTNSVPSTHQRGFEVETGAVCVPPNELPRLAAVHAHFTVLGAGKTGMDSCIWLLANGVAPERISWVIPRDCWLWNRAQTQPTLEAFEAAFGGFRDQQRAIANANSPRDLALRMEAAGVWLRLDPSIEPTVYRGATVSPREVEMLREIGDTIRLGRVKSLSREGIVLEQGTVASPPDTLYIDCSAKALGVSAPPTRPVFEPGRVTVQMIRFPQITFSAALIAYLESQFDTDEERNSFAAPITVEESLAGFVRALAPDFANRIAASNHRDVRRWIASSRLDGFAALGRSIDPGDTARVELMRDLREASFAAFANLPSLMASAQH